MLFLNYKNNSNANYFYCITVTLEFYMLTKIWMLYCFYVTFFCINITQFYTNISFTYTFMLSQTQTKFEQQYEKQKVPTDM